MCARPVWMHPFRVAFERHHKWPTIFKLSALFGWNLHLKGALLNSVRHPREGRCGVWANVGDTWHREHWEAADDSIRQQRARPLCVYCHGTHWACCIQLSISATSDVLSILLGGFHSSHLPPLFTCPCPRSLLSHLFLECCDDIHQAGNGGGGVKGRVSVLPLLSVCQDSSRIISVTIHSQCQTMLDNAPVNLVCTMPCTIVSKTLREKKDLSSWLKSQRMLWEWNRK